MLRTVLVACTALVMVQQAALSQTVISGNPSRVVQSMTTQRPVTYNQPTVVQSSGRPFYNSSQVFYPSSARTSSGQMIYRTYPSTGNGTVVRSYPSTNSSAQRVNSNGSPGYSQRSVSRPVSSRPVSSRPVSSRSVSSQPTDGHGTIIRSSPSQSASVGQSAPAFNGGDSELLNLVNNERAQRGLAPLSMDPGLMSGALQHSMNQSRSGRMYHAGSYGAAENVANGVRSAQQVMRMWMNSAGHRANILNPGFRYFGGGQSGSFWTQRFR